MRITNNITTQNALRAMQRGQRDLATASQRASSGLRFQRASEDPSAAAQVMRAAGSLRSLTQYRRNVDAATARSSSEESVLDQLNKLLTRAVELGVSQGTDTASAQTRSVAKAEVDQLIRSALSLANTRYGDDYLFGGTQVTVAPATLDETDPANPDFTIAPPGQSAALEVSAGQLVVPAHDAATIFGDCTSGPLAMLRDLSRALGANDRVAIAGVTARGHQAISDTQTLVGDMGARLNQLEITSANLNAFEVTLTTFKSDLQEVDMERAITELIGKQTAYQAAMLATSRVLGMNLTDYMR